MYIQPEPKVEQRVIPSPPAIAKISVSVAPQTSITVTGSAVQFSSVQLENFYINQGIYYAFRLLHSLRILETLRDEAISPIMSILEPFIVATSDMESDMLSGASTGVIGNVVNDETAQTEVADVRDMSFFRFLDELESRAYTADDLENEE